ncbi:MAG: pantetheine-phosphate adenylyltransferase [Flavipsychrobacter sp.]
MERICLFPGTFDPITKGHVDLIERSLPLFDKIIVGIGTNSTKQPMFTLEQRMEWINNIFQNEPKVEVGTYSGLTVNYCNEIGAKFIMRGIRYITDFEYERAIADMNRSLTNSVETIFLSCRPEYSTLSSTLVREVLRYGGDVSEFLPEAVKP